MEDAQNKPTYIWDGAVGAKIETRTNKKTGEQFSTFEIIRRYKDETVGQWKYPKSFTCRNKEAFYKIAEQAFAMISNVEESDAPVEQVPDTTRHVVGKITPIKIPANQAIIG